MMQKAINIKAKIGLKSNIIVWDLDVYCPRGYHLSHNTSLKIQTQSSNNKDFSCSEELKLKYLKPILSCDNAIAELIKKKDRKDQKKRF